MVVTYFSQFFLLMPFGMITGQQTGLIHVCRWPAHEWRFKPERLTTSMQPRAGDDGFARLATLQQQLVTQDASACGQAPDQLTFKLPPV